ncbi:hypothetical protein OH77DRAFT_1556810, partial [Trametes cingulata]
HNHFLRRALLRASSVVRAPPTRAESTQWHDADSWGDRDCDLVSSRVLWYMVYDGHRHYGSRRQVMGQVVLGYLTEDGQFLWQSTPIAECFDIAQEHVQVVVPEVPSGQYFIAHMSIHTSSHAAGACDSPSRRTHLRQWKAILRTGVSCLQSPTLRSPPARHLSRSSSLQ